MHSGAGTSDGIFPLRRRRKDVERTGVQSQYSPCGGSNLLLPRPGFGRRACRLCYENLCPIQGGTESKISPSFRKRKRVTEGSKAEKGEELFTNRWFLWTRARDMLANAALISLRGLSHLINSGNSWFYNTLFDEKTPAVFLALGHGPHNECLKGVWKLYQWRSAQDRRSSNDSN